MWIFNKKMLPEEKNLESIECSCCAVTDPTNLVVVGNNSLKCVEDWNGVGLLNISQINKFSVVGNTIYLVHKQI